MDPSPLTRGKLTLTHSLPLPHWLIPAHAGENVHDARLEGDGRGLSPLTRGKPGRTPVRSTPAGLIPAHAGKTNSAGLYPISLPAHPSSRGENSYEASVTFPRPGSSPLTRGKPRSTLSASRAQRLIPAHSGKTRWSAPKHPPNSAHPRSRGENSILLLRRALRAGSSPLTRGKLGGALQVEGHCRLIPAHAGKTWLLPAIAGGALAHPRSRGENFSTTLNSMARAGSSPLTRGKRGGTDQIGNIRGLIPAHAGKTSASSWAPSGATAHPRSRGENDFVRVREGFVRGSSPLTRGKLRQLIQGLH